MSTARDRNDYRSLSTSALLEEVTYAIRPNWRELAIALAERLQEREKEFETFKWELNHDV